MSNIKLWGGKGVWALMDQFFFAVSNFIISILLARWVTPEEYGTYSIAFSIFLFLGAVHCGIISNPMMVLSASKYKKDLAAYFGGIVYTHWAFSAAAMLCVLLTGGITWIFVGPGFGSALLCMGLASPFILFQWIMRHIAYADLKPKLAAAAGGIHCFTIILGVSFCYKLNCLTPAIAFCMMGATSFLSAFWLSKKLDIDHCHKTRVKYMKAIFKSHKEFGSWGTGVVILHWVSGEIFLVLSPLFGGLQAAAILRAMLNLIIPINRAFTAFGTLAVVGLGRARAAGQLGKAMQLAFLAAGLIGVGYWLFLGLFHEQITKLLYGEGLYKQGGNLIWIIGLMAVVGGFKAVLEPALWALEKPKSLFLSYLISTGFIATVGIGLMITMGTTGVALAMVSGGIVSALAMAGFVICSKGKDTKPIENTEVDSVDLTDPDFAKQR